jgi:glycosyltransferase involved in cell wall biosynthesis
MSVSVIIPVYNAAEHLRVCLQHLAQWPAGPLELIVVDDGSTDESVDVARSFHATVLSTGGRKGPARARNIGARAARGEILFFIDSDVCVHQDTLERVRRDFKENPDLDALIGSYDMNPQSPDFISQYKNLMHSFVHQKGKRRACTFWSGCGAIRREVFFQHAGFDESYARPAIEDIELGYRLREAGRNMLLDKDLQVTHLKHWTFWSLLKTDVLDRGIPWTELILRDNFMPNDLNLELSQRVSVALAFLLVGLALAAATLWRGFFITPIFALLVFLLASYWLEFASGKRSVVWWLGTGTVLAVIVWMAYAFKMTPILPPLLLGCLLLVLRHRYAHQSARKRRLSGVILTIYIVASIIYFLTHLPRHPLIFSFFLVAAAIVVINNQFYAFLAAKRGRMFALAAVPFHLLYHLYNGFSFVAGFVCYWWMRLTGHAATATERSATNRP